MDKDVKNRYAMGGVLILVILIAFAYKKMSSLPDCQDDPAAKIVIVIDQTDPVTPLQRNEINKRALTFLNNSRVKSPLLYGAAEIKQQDAPVNSLVTIFNITSDYKNLKPALVICRPARKSDVNAITDDPKSKERDYTNLFLIPVSEKLTMTGVPDKASPILETLAAISRTNYFSPLGSGKQKTKVLIFSDLVQFSDSLNMYGCNDPASIKDSPLIRSVRESYKNAEVFLNVIDRDKKDSLNLPSNQCLSLFWQKELNPIESEAL
jgi:hypothetical protein